MSRALKKAALRSLVFLFDSALLWCFNWKRVRTIKGLVHYQDPLNQDNYWLRDKAVSICESRARKCLSE